MVIGPGPSVPFSQELHAPETSYERHLRLKREAARRLRATPKGLAASRKANRENSRRVGATPEGREARRAYCAHRYHTDPVFRLTKILRARLYDALNGRTKSAATVELVGCPVSALLPHLEAQFLPGMSWENYGEWHVDHRRPCASFDLSDPEEQRACFHFTNLQPLWVADHRIKTALDARLAREAA